MDETGHLVVARCSDGNMVRGTTEDFDPERFFFHVWDHRTREPVRVLRDQLKAAFFVKSLYGDPHRGDRKTFDREEHARTKVWVRFRDGEELAGWTEEYDPRKSGFTLHPTDPESNIERAWIPHVAAESVLLGEDAETASRAFDNLFQERRRRITPRDWDVLLAIEPADLARARAEHQQRVSARLRERAQARRTPRR